MVLLVRPILAFHNPSNKFADRVVKFEIAFPVRHPLIHSVDPSSLTRSTHSRRPSPSSLDIIKLNTNEGHPTDIPGGWVQPPSADWDADLGRGRYGRKEEIKFPWCGHVFRPRRYQKVIKVIKVPQLFPV